MNLICGCKRRLPIVMGEQHCARCLVEMALSGGTVCLAKLEAEAERRQAQEREMWEEFEYEQECEDFHKALDELRW